MPDTKTNAVSCNIYRYPNQEEIDSNTQNTNDTVTVGDMHGNTIKLLWILINFGIIKMRPEDFESIVKKYIKILKNNALSIPPNNVGQLLHEFSEDLKKIEIVTNSKFKKMRLIGDVFGDRGANDYLTLLLINKLNQASDTIFEFMLGNHDAYLFDYLHYPDTTLVDKEKVDFYRSIIGFASNNNQGNSLINLMAIASSNPGVYNSIKNLVEKDILPSTKLISYDLYKENNEEKINLFMHAPNPFSRIILIAKTLGVKLPNSSDIKKISAQELASYIDQINYKFMQRLKTNLIINLEIFSYPYVFNDAQQFEKHIEILNSSGNIEDSNKALGLLLCHSGSDGANGRGASGFIWDDGKLIKTNDYPECVNSIYHGHIGQQENINILFENLDTNIGKFDFKEGELYFNSCKTLKPPKEKLKIILSNLQNTQKSKFTYPGSFLLITSDNVNKFRNDKDCINILNDITVNSKNRNVEWLIADLFDPKNKLDANNVLFWVKILNNPDLLLNSKFKTIKESEINNTTYKLIKSVKNNKTQKDVREIEKINLLAQIIKSTKFEANKIIFPDTLPKKDSSLKTSKEKNKKITPATTPSRPGTPSTREETPQPPKKTKPRFFQQTSSISNPKTKGLFKKTTSFIAPEEQKTEKSPLLQKKVSLSNIPKQQEKIKRLFQKTKPPSNFKKIKL